MAKIRSDLHSGQYASSIPSDYSQGQVLMEPLSFLGVTYISTRFFSRQLKKEQPHIALGAE